ncbi:hypothetical protein TNIN_476621 [Trichonephila inaurata madagascariensis]|uniref:Uncharacterized protein n=1 Tax=Trichonephila inaurata madagascariensis TaxID=2747483 RepID=A0A8X6XQH7_9ARAC|nr:hypothetical protein TNIN_476621 [Trichonephila inaurata madagascariensis]
MGRLMNAKKGATLPKLLITTTCASQKGVGGRKQIDGVDVPDYRTEDRRFFYLKLRITTRYLFAISSMRNYLIGCGHDGVVEKDTKIDGEE